MRKIAGGVRAGSDRGTMWTTPFLARLAGIVHVARSSDSSAHVMPPTSSRRWPVKMSIRTMPLNAPPPFGCAPHSGELVVSQDAVALRRAPRAD